MSYFHETDWLKKSGDQNLLLLKSLLLKEKIII